MWSNSGVEDPKTSFQNGMSCSRFRIEFCPGPCKEHLKRKRTQQKARGGWKSDSETSIYCAFLRVIPTIISYNAQNLFRNFWDKEKGNKVKVLTRRWTQRGRRKTHKQSNSMAFMAGYLTFPKMNITKFGGNFVQNSAWTPNFSHAYLHQFGFLS